MKYATAILIENIMINLFCYIYYYLGDKGDNSAEQVDL